jgi:hypothetical protein
MHLPDESERERQRIEKFRSTAECLGVVVDFEPIALPIAGRDRLLRFQFEQKQLFR